MLPLGRPWAAARDFWIFGGFLRFLTRYIGDPNPLIAANAGLVAGNHGQRMTASGSPVAGCRLPVAGCRITGRYVWGIDRGSGRGLFNWFNAATLAGKRA